MMLIWKIDTKELEVFYSFHLRVINFKVRFKLVEIVERVAMVEKFRFDDEEKRIIFLIFDEELNLLQGAWCMVHGTR